MTKIYPYLTTEILLSMTGMSITSISAVHQRILNLSRSFMLTLYLTVNVRVWIRSKGPENPRPFSLLFSPLLSATRRHCDSYVKVCGKYRLREGLSFHRRSWAP